MQENIAMTEPVSTQDSEQKPYTAPENFVVCARAFDTEEHARSLGDTVGAYVRILSSHFDLSRLDGSCIRPKAIGLLIHGRRASVACSMNIWC